VRRIGECSSQGGSAGERFERGEARSTRGSVSAKSRPVDKPLGKDEIVRPWLEFRQRAEMCLQNAETATHKRDKTDWVKLGGEWLRLAEEVDPSPAGTDCDHDFPNVETGSQSNSGRSTPPLRARRRFAIKAF